MQPRTLLKIVQLFLYFVVVGTPLFYLARGVYPYGLAKSLFFQGAGELLFVSWLLLAWADPRFRVSWTPITKSLAVFGGILLLTTLTGVDPWRSFWSTQERAVGVFTVFHLGALALVVRVLARETRMEPFLFASVGISVVTAFIAFLQLRIPSLLLNEAIGARPGSTFGNPSFLAGYLAFNLFLIAYLFMQHISTYEGVRRSAHSRSGFAFFIVAAAANVVALFLTETRGDIVGVAVGVFILLALFAINPPSVSWRVLNQRRTYQWALAVLIAFGLVFFATRGSALWRAIPGVARFQEISFSNDVLAPRLIALRAAWKGFLERPVFGWGWDNYNIVFNKYYDPRALEVNYQETRFDKPHNFALEYLAVGGFPLALAYAAVFAAFIWEARRLRNRLLGSIFIAAAGAYAVRNLFIFETIGPFLMWFIAIGLVDGWYARERDALAVIPRAFPARRISRAAVGVCIAVAFVPVYVFNILSLQASHYQFLGFNYFINGKVETAIQNFRRAISVWSPFTWNLKRDYAVAVAEAHFYNPGRVPDEEVRRALQGMEEVAAEHPLDAYHHYALVDMYNQTSDIDPAAFLKKAEAEAAHALALSPDRQEVYFSLAKTKSLQGKNEEALVLLDKAMALAPKVADAHFYYGLISFALGNQKRGYEEIKTARALGRKWKKYHEPRVVANFFADSGHLEEAIALYEEAVRMEPSDLEARAKLGIAYFISGDRARAKQYLEEVSRKFDFRKSPSYDSLEPIFDELKIILPDNGK